MSTHLMPQESRVLPSTSLPDRGYGATHSHTSLPPACEANLCTNYPPYLWKNTYENIVKIRYTKLSRALPILCACPFPAYNLYPIYYVSLLLALPEHHEQTTVAANTPAVFLSPPIELHLLAKNTLHSPIDIAGLDAPVVGVSTFLPLSRAFRCSLGNIHLPSYVPLFKDFGGKSCTGLQPRSLSAESNVGRMRSASQCARIPSFC